MNSKDFITNEKNTARKENCKNHDFLLMANIWMCLIFYSSDFRCQKAHFISLLFVFFRWILSIIFLLWRMEIFASIKVELLQLIWSTSMQRMTNCIPKTQSLVPLLITGMYSKEQNKLTFCHHHVKLVVFKRVWGLLKCCHAFGY